MEEVTKGRKPQPPSEETAQRLRELYERRLLANEELLLAVLDCIEREGASLRQIAMVLGVGKSTVGNWARDARQLRGG